MYLREQTAPSTPPAKTTVLYTKDNAGTPALFVKDDGGKERRIGTTAFITAITFGWDVSPQVFAA